MSKPVLILIIVIAVIVGISACLGILAFLSYQTTQYYWDGGFPLSEVQLTLIDDSGQPIPGAQVSVYDTITGEPTYEYPFTEYTSSKTPTSDANGKLTLHQELIGLQFGGSGWDLFWIFPMGSQDAPMYNIEITADDYQTLNLGIWDLLDSPSGQAQTKPYDIYGEEYEMLIYSHTYTLSSEN